MVKHSDRLTSKWINAADALLITPFDLRAWGGEIRLRYSATDPTSTTIHAVWAPRWGQLFSWGRGREELRYLDRLLAAATKEPADPVFVFEGTDLVSIFEDVEEANAYLEAVDVRAGAYPIAYDAHGHVFEVFPHLDNARLVPTGVTNLADLCQRLRRVHGPQHLADQPGVYARNVMLRDV